MMKFYKSSVLELQKNSLKNVSVTRHKSSQHTKYRKSTEIPKYIWKLKDANISPGTEWSIITKVLSKT